MLHDFQDSLGRFKKGLIPLNKGTGIQTNDALEVWRKNGGVPWNKNKHIALNDCLIKWRKEGNGKDEKHPRWKGQDASQVAIHIWIRKNFADPKKCGICGENRIEKLEWAHKTHKYDRIRENWQRLCTFCHKRFDSKNWRKTKNSWLKRCPVCKKYLEVNKNYGLRKSTMNDGDKFPRYSSNCRNCHI